MSDNTFTWLLLTGAVGVAAYRWGQSRGSAGSSSSKQKTPDRPLPELPPPPERADYSFDWDAALDRYAIDVYPPEAEPDVEYRIPPPSVDGVSTSSDCKVVAVGEDWWELVAARAAEVADRPLKGRVKYALQYAAPTCVSRGTPGAIALRQAVSDWLSPNRNPRSLPTPIPYPGPLPLPSAPADLSAYEARRVVKGRHHQTSAVWSRPTNHPVEARRTRNGEDDAPPGG